MENEVISLPTSELPPLTIRLFGGFEVKVNGSPLPPLRTRKGQWLLALLVLRSNREVARDWLAGTLWPDSPERLAGANLRNALYNLRLALGPEARRLLSPTPHSLRFDLSDAWCDLIVFDAAIVQGDDPALEEAMQLYQGILLEECTEEWVFQERRIREESYIKALETLATHALNRSEAAQAIPFLKKIVAVDPSREDAQCQLMEALAMHGDFVGILQSYRAFRLYLHEEFQATPSNETVALYQRLRESKPISSPRTSSNVRISPTADLFAPYSLPCSLTSLIGREQEIAEVTSCLNAMRLVTLTGTGGVGKTRLALAIGESLADAYADGVCFVELASLSDAALVPQAVATAMRIKESTPQTLLETLLNALHHRNLLLILDNCEHLFEACAELAQALLSRCPMLRILATSRQRLNLPGERLWRVPSLASPPLEARGTQDKNLVANLMEYSAVQLFVERAVGSGGEFPLTTTNLEAVAQICRRLDGVALAIELTAVRMRALSLERIVALLEDRFDLTVGKGTGILPRHQTLQATLDWSCDLLSEEEQALLRRLSVFAGGWTLEAAEAVCTDEAEDSERTSGAMDIPSSAVLDLLTNLVDASLVVYEEQTDGTGRYRLLEMVRDFANKKQLLGGNSSLYDSHASYYLDIIVTLGKMIENKNTFACYRIADQELGNILAAFRWSWKQGDRMHAALALSIMNHFWYSRSLASEGRHQINMALAFREEYDHDVLGELLSGAGTLAYAQGSFVESEELFLLSLHQFRESGNRSAAAYACNDLAVIASERHDDTMARSYLEESLALFHKEKQLVGVAYTLTLIGRELATSGEYLRAIDALQEAIGIANQNGIDDHLAFSLASLGYCQNCVHDYAEAKETLRQALALCREQGHRPGIASASANLGLSYLYMDENEEALFYWNEALTIWEEQGDTASIHLFKPQFEN